MLNSFNISNPTAVSFIRKVLVLFVISQATNAQDTNSNIEQYLQEIDRIEATERESHAMQEPFSPNNMEAEELGMTSVDELLAQERPQTSPVKAKKGYKNPLSVKLSRKKKTTSKKKKKKRKTKSLNQEHSLSYNARKMFETMLQEAYGK